MIRWERLRALAVPVVVIFALSSAVRGAWMFGERWGWIALAVAGMLLAFIMDSSSETGNDQQADTQAAQTQVLRPGGVIR